ncbi:aminomethyl-transferring glycine dehydrogenase [Couchioplanes caeruleus]|uniref:Glycine dehydrogenase (decarboxylating) n=2 Tax=Couchioplanes caeruleus TaxID=56438 RepID=A0A1K0GVN4_9ACTN|nr:aminomethyl-transferring glycine dehydrogenase [Couchioplanes caeruleus]OJF15444.1 glycine dehydrogenase (aminomethyl-transferring) [Couchioplanes caeruleus subsp. caeruleus]ROP27491.1 glycine dehydrogenase (decarboxylating) alpha subunit /glycine dehydrogenase (decarboxylating) beta subunit [Couchioplanes caeruleus]
MTFALRHIGPDPDAQTQMLKAIGYASLDALMDAAIPEVIRWHGTLALPPAASEEETIAELREIAGRNAVTTSMIGLGYYGTVTPAVIRRNVMENPAWYTAYTPYQPEISQGRLEALLNFQTMVTDLTGMATANASMLDEGTAVAEAMTLARRSSKSKSNVYAVDADTLPQTLAVLRTRAEPLGIELRLVDLDAGGELPAEYFGLHLQYPGASGAVRDHAPLVEAAHAAGALVTVAADLLALALLRAPGEIGADIAAGTTQRFGVPLGFGGPHAGYLAVRAGLERSLPGRLVGVSRDADGAPAYRLALQTREQHIRRERATSNICTAQVLLAVMASMYAVYHGPRGLRAIAQRVHDHALALAGGLAAAGVEVAHAAFFDTVTAVVPARAAAVVAAAAEAGIDLRFVDEDRVSVSCDETTTAAVVADVLAAFGAAPAVAAQCGARPLARTTDYLTHPVFSTHHSETAMLRYLRRLSDSDYALDRGMIPLGSCTMKLNATTEMEPVTWPEFADIHPFAPASRTAGYEALVAQLEAWLAEITGYDAVSVQPNAGSQGELAGLLAIRGYHRARGDVHRDVCLIPSSAHGTNAASAVMAGMRVVVVACDDNGNVDLADLDAKIAKHRDALAAIMVTYPSTHGVYERGIAELCGKVHDAGGQVYVDGANLNALVGFARPGKFGADVSHLNLHKTFCIPHGGGGPGVGPVAVRSHLAEFLPGDPLEPGDHHAVSAAAHGSAGILPISWAYLRMMGPDGLAQATSVAVLAANYVAVRLREHYPVLYAGNEGLVAHECILDLRPITKATGVSVDDVAKRLIDYGFHAPTMSFPVAGTLMVEPTESEDLAELDRFCAAMIAIKGEIDRVAAGEWPRDDNPLHHAPHTAAAVSADEWPHAYPRSLAGFPEGVDRAAKYWPPVRRIDGAYGDRNLVCSCPSPEAFED